MRRALDVAKRAPAGDVPVGAVLYDAAGTELATGVNRREELADPTAPFTPQVRGGVLEGECAGLLRNFFDGLR